MTDRTLVVEAKGEQIALSGREVNVFFAEGRRQENPDMLAVAKRIEGLRA